MRMIFGFPLGDSHGKVPLVVKPVKGKSLMTFPAINVHFWGISQLAMFDY